MNQRALAQQAAPAPDPPEVRQDLVGTSAAMLAIWKLIGRAAGSDAPVLITGETGTGKELVARAIHDYSSRARAPFVAVNLAALPPTLIESELFGHERGAFTGATARRGGRFEPAAGGTLFLDEIGDLDPALQTKLLRVLQDGTFERVGGDKPLTTARASSRRPTGRSARARRARRCARISYYRLAVIEIELPPLRARRSDIPLLVAHALRGPPARAVSEEAMERLLANPWPGNVRELFHVLERAAVLCGGEVIDVGDLPGRRPRGAARRALAAADDDDLTLNAAVARRREADDRARAGAREGQPLRGRAPARHRPPAALREAGRARPRRLARRLIEAPIRSRIPSGTVRVALPRRHRRDALSYRSVAAVRETITGFPGTPSARLRLTRFSTG